MKVLLWGLNIFFLSFVLHIIVWRIHLPDRQIKALLMIFFGVLILGIIVFYVYFNSVPNVSLFVPNNFLEYLHICIFYISLSLVYIITYPAIEADSPSLVMIMAIAKEGAKGLAEERFLEILNDDLLIKPRIRDITNAKMIYLDQNTYKLTNKGILFIRIFIFYRRLLNVSKGG